MSWKNYYETVGRQPNLRLVKFLKNVSTGKELAIDLGCGNMRNAEYLLSQNFKKVIAVDSNSDAKNFCLDGIDFYNTSIQNFEIDYLKADLIVCFHTLYFLPKKDIKKLFKKVYQSLKVGGYFMGNLLTPNDEWIESKIPDTFSLTKLELFLSTYRFSKKSIRKFEEDGTTSDGKYKFWSRWNIILKK